MKVRCSDFKRGLGAVHGIVECLSASNSFSYALIVGFA
jgi:hypothetical protein